jgi:hypothetical protein
MEGIPCDNRYGGAVAVERSELQLVWPPDLFRREGQALLDAGNDDESRLGWLLAEAFHGDRGYGLFIQTPAPWTGWDEGLVNGYKAPAPPRGPSPRAQLVAGLVRDTDQLPRYVLRQYYSARRNPLPEATPRTLAQTKAAYAQVIVALSRTGYFGDAFGSSCADNPDDPAEHGQRKLSSLLHTDRPMWPLARDDGELTGVEQGWSEDLFFDVVEALHDLVARPRWRGWHDYDQHWDYQDFARTPGQAVYRWKVNEVLARSEVPLQLAADGEDMGRLVHASGDDRDELVEQALQTPNPGDRDAVRHAVALFRSRDADRENKRSAVLALHRVLEVRRSLIKAELMSKDSGALFDIANRFDLRHRRADQRTDYDPAFLDWIFWWYLATIELTDRLLTRRDDGA